MNTVGRKYGKRTEEEVEAEREEKVNMQDLKIGKEANKCNSGRENVQTW